MEGEREAVCRFYGKQGNPSGPREHARREELGAGYVTCTTVYIRICTKQQKDLNRPGMRCSNFCSQAMAEVAKLDTASRYDIYHITYKLETVESSKIPFELRHVNDFAEAPSSG